MNRIILAAAILCASFSIANAGPRDMPMSASNAPDGQAIYGKSFRADVRGPLQPQMFTRKKKPETVDVFGNATFQPQRAMKRVANFVSEILPHPAGCRRNLFCGCGSSVYLGKGVVNAGGLALARNWLGFPRAAPGPGMAEVLRGGGHVRIIEADLGGGYYQFYDPNSGRGLTRRHADVIRGIVVNPSGHSRYASVM